MSMINLNDSGTPLMMTGRTMDARLGALREEINAINTETNPVARFFLKLKYLFKYEEFPPSDTDGINKFDAIPLYNNIRRSIQNAPDNGDGCIKIKDATSAYDLTYLRCTNIWSVTARAISEDGQISNKISGQQTIPHQKMLEFVGVQPTDVVSAKDYSNAIKQSFEKNQAILKFIPGCAP